MPEITLPMLVAFIGLAIGTYTDFKTREVPDWVNYGLIIAGFGINAIYSIVLSTWSFLIYAVLGFGICFLLSLLMFYTGQWGGGDSKMLMGLGALIGFKLNFRNEFLLDFLVNIIIFGGFYGLIWSVFLAYRNKAKVINFWRRFSANKTAQKIKNMIFVVIFILFISSLVVRDKIFLIYILMISVFSVLTFYLWVFVKSIEGSAMIKAVTPYKLTEGDWIARDVYFAGKYICGPKDLGISKKQIRELKRLYNIGKIKKIIVKEGIPFVPSFLVAYLATVFVGSVLGLIL